MQTVCDDSSFGPLIHGCRGNFDFTFTFEETILSAAPSLAITIASLVRVFQLRKRPSLLRGIRFRTTKTIAICVYGLLQITLLALLKSHKILETWPSVLATTLSAVAAGAFCLLSLLEHSRNSRPSTVLLLYLFFSIWFDIVHTRTLWLMMPGSSFTRLFTASTVTKVAIMILEAREKGRYLPSTLRNNCPEQISSIFNRSVFFWLNGLLWSGSRGMIKPEHLYSLDQDMVPSLLTPSFLKLQDDHHKIGKKRPTARALFTLLRWDICGAVIPRAIQLVPTVCSPLLLNKLLLFLEEPDIPQSDGYAILIGFTMVYFGQAICIALYWHSHMRTVAKVRGILVSAISWHTTKLDIGQLPDQKAALTLMSADVERVTSGLRSLHEMWASILQVAISVYLLERQVGSACYIPIVFALVCTGLTAFNSKILIRRQAAWMEKLQYRLSAITSLLSSIKGVKMRGLESKMSSTIQTMRLEELAKASKYRWSLVWTVCLGYAPATLNPTLLFLVFAADVGKSGFAFTASRAFTIVSILSIMSEPLNSIFQTAPALVSAMGCLDRIDEYLQSEVQRDFRTPAAQAMPISRPQTSDPNTSDMELQTIPKTSSALGDNEIIRFTNVQSGYKAKPDILKDINLSIEKGKLTYVIGPVASGKSTLCKTLIGETHLAQGSVEFGGQDLAVGFCDQESFLMSDTIKNNIIAFSEFESTWYTTVVRACSLDSDIKIMPLQDDTKVGSNGVSLSGGQRQRVALARALYSRRPVMVLDDIFSGLDTWSESHIFRNVFAEQGLARQHAITVVLSTHSTRFLHTADHIIVLDCDGKVSQSGSYTSLRSNDGYVKELILSHRGAESETAAKTDLEDGFTATTEIVDSTVADDDPRKTGEMKVYAYYFKAGGKPLVVALVVISALEAALYTVPSYWVEVWTGASPAQRQASFFYWGIYALLQIGALAVLVAEIYVFLVVLANRTGRALHSQALQAAMNSSWSYLSSTEIGIIINHFSQDMELIDGELPLGLLNFVAIGFLVMAQCALVIASLPWVGIAFPVVFGILYCLQKFYLRTSRQLRFFDLEAKSPLYTNFMETVKGISTIRAFGWSEENYEKTITLLEQSQRPYYLFTMTQKWLGLVLDIIVACLVVIITAIAVVERSKAGAIGVALTQVMSMNELMTYMILVWTQVETSIGAVSRLRSFCIEAVSEHRTSECIDPPLCWPENGSIEFNSVVAQYSLEASKKAIDDISFTVKAGEKVGICGPSGSGKSSLVLAFLRMIEMSSGSITIDGVDHSTMPRPILRSRLNVIPQEPSFFAGSVRINLDPEQTLEDAPLSSALEKVGLSAVLPSLDEELDPSILSQGQRQLFCMAAAMVRKSNIVILDEASSNVDQATERRMQELIATEFAECTVIAVAHRLEAIVNFDKIVVLEKGKLKETGTPQELMKTDSYFGRMWAERGHSS